MSEAFKLKIQRDHLDRIISRITEEKGASWTVLYSYNINGDISETLFMENNVVTRKQEYQYEHDQYGNKTIKTVYMIDVIGDTKTKSTYMYCNDYCENRITKKVCFYDGIKLYENMYYYNEGKLDRIERFNNRDGFGLWRVELFNHQESLIEKKIYLANNVLSHYVIYKFLDGALISKRVLNPLKGRYHWSLSSFNDNFCSIYVGENLFTCEVLAEMLSYVLRIKKVDTEYLLVVVECSDVIVDSSDKKLQEVEQAYKNHGIIVQYSP